MLHILLIEDNPHDILLIREAIRTSPAKADVLIAYDGEQALRMLNESGVRPDFIVLDLSIPRFDGFEVLRRYRADQGHPVAVFTASSNADEERKARELG